MKKLIVPVPEMTRRIFLIRGHRVMIDRDLAEMYGIKTHVLNQAVTRNAKRFPDDFMFRLTKEEAGKLITNCDNLLSLKYSPTTPRAFTEQGVAMLSSVLKSECAIEVNIAIMRAFVRIRELASTHKTILRKLEDLERKSASHDVKIKAIFEAIKELITIDKKPGRTIGFRQSGVKP